MSMPLTLSSVATILKTILLFCFWEKKKYSLGSCGIGKKNTKIKKAFYRKSKTNLTLVFMHSEKRMFGKVLGVLRLLKLQK